jgi:hypothetical protein
VHLLFRKTRIPVAIFAMLLRSLRSMSRVVGLIKTCTLTEDQYETLLDHLALAAFAHSSDWGSSSCHY